jgi:hypothetical protein
VDLREEAPVSWSVLDYIALRPRLIARGERLVPPAEPPLAVLERLHKPSDELPDPHALVPVFGPPYAGPPLKGPFSL